MNAYLVITSNGIMFAFIDDVETATKRAAQVFGVVAVVPIMRDFTLEARNEH